RRLCAVNGWSVKTRRCFIGDGGGPPGVGLQGQAPNRHKLLGSRVLVVSVVERRRQFRQVWVKKTNVSETLMSCRKVSNRRRNRDLDFYPASKGWERPAYCPTGVRHEGA